VCVRLQEEHVKEEEEEEEEEGGDGWVDQGGRRTRRE